MRTNDHCHFRDSGTFAKYVGKYVRYYILTLPRPIVPSNGYPMAPKTWGEHVRKRRLDLGFYQAQVAKRIGVNESSVWNWEHGTTPAPQRSPENADEGSGLELDGE